MANEGNYLASKPRYEILDGLRGVAAMLVVLYHIFLAIGAAYASLKVYDIPVWKWHTERWLKGQKKKASEEYNRVIS